MSSSTPNIGLTLPVGGENVSRQIINENNTKIDNYAGTLNSKLLKPVTVTVDPITNASGSYNHTTSGVTLITEDMKAIDIEVGTPETFKAPVTVTTGNHTVNVSCPSVSGSSTITITFIHTEPVEGGQNVPAQITSTEFDILAGRIGNLSSLQTSVKTDTVSAINSLSEQIENYIKATDGFSKIFTGDLNTLKTVGRYFVNYGSTNVPTGMGNSDGFIDVYTYDNNYVRQAYRPTQKTIVFERVCINGTWGDWYSLSEQIANNSMVKIIDVSIAVSGDTSWHDTTDWQSIATDYKRFFVKARVHGALANSAIIEKTVLQLIDGSNEFSLSAYWDNNNMGEIKLAGNNGLKYYANAKTKDFAFDIIIYGIN